MRTLKTKVISSTFPIKVQYFVSIRSKHWAQKVKAYDITWSINPWSQQVLNVNGLSWIENSGMSHQRNRQCIVENTWDWPKTEWCTYMASWPWCHSNSVTWYTDLFASFHYNRNQVPAATRRWLSVPPGLFADAWMHQVKFCSICRRS